MFSNERRTALVALARAAFVGSTFALTGCRNSSAEKKKDDEGEVNANEDLMREHGVLHLSRDLAEAHCQGCGDRRGSTSMRRCCGLLADPQMSALARKLPLAANGTNGWNADTSRPRELS
jgi:hypothetical protein